MYKVPTLKCTKCGHTWIPRKDEVKLCPNCKTAYWDVERDEDGKIVADTEEKIPVNTGVSDKRSLNKRK